MEHFNYGLDNLKQTLSSDNLNLLYPKSAENYGRLRESYLDSYCSAMIKPIYRNIEQELVKEIGRHDLILGCVAWLTSIPVLTALQGKNVQFVVQQEDWLRPDSNDLTMEAQRRLYDGLKGIDNYTAWASTSNYHNISPIRLSGKPKNHKRNNARMHHKFLLFGRYGEVEYEGGTVNGVGKPFIDLVWTGSYNLTHNATRSLENGVFIRSEEVAESYYNEWRQILLSSFRIEDRWWGAKYAWGGCDNEDWLRDGT